MINMHGGCGYDSMRMWMRAVAKQKNFYHRHNASPFGKYQVHLADFRDYRKSRWEITSQMQSLDDP